MSTASICPVNKPSWTPRSRAVEQNQIRIQNDTDFMQVNVSWVYYHFVILPVTFVPMLSLKGISSGRSLQFDTSDIFPCCSKRIFCLFCPSALRSSPKNADEHLDRSTKALFKETCLKNKTKQKNRQKYFTQVEMSKNKRQKEV